MTRGSRPSGGGPRKHVEERRVADELLQEDAADHRVGDEEPQDDDALLHGEAADRDVDAASSFRWAGGPVPIRPATRLPNRSGAMGRSIYPAPSQAQSETSHPRWAGSSVLLRPRGTRLPADRGQPLIHTGAMGRSISLAPSQALR